MRRWLARRLDGRVDPRRLARALYGLSYTLFGAGRWNAAWGEPKGFRHRLGRWQQQWTVCAIHGRGERQRPLTIYDVLRVPGLGRAAALRWDLEESRPCT